MRDGFKTSRAGGAVMAGSSNWGGSRSRSGPRPDENSGRSDKRGFKLNALPTSGYSGPVPNFPLPDATPRELEVWERVWRTPQGHAWAQASEAWRTPTIGMWVRVTVRCEAPDAPASLLGQLHRFADQVGMTTTGLADMGWKVAPQEIDPDQDKPAARPRSSRDRMKLVPPPPGGEKEGA